jgi:hypothetical protein
MWGLDNRFLQCYVVAGQWFSSGTPVSSTNNTNSHDIAEILLKWL